MDESELIEEAKKGNKKALAEIVKRYEQTIYNFAFKICRDPEKAENIMQETFYSMVKSINQFDRKSKLSTWLYRIVANHCLMQARKEKRRNYISLENDEDLYSERHIADWASLPYKSTENKELRQVLDNAIRKLAPDYRIIFLLRDVEGLSTEETAEAANISVPAVKSRLHRARAFLRKEIDEAFKK